MRLAPVHLIDPATGVYNEHLLRAGLALVRGWQRMQGIVFRPGDTRFEGKQRGGRACKAALADPILPHGQPQCRRRHARADRPAARRRAAARLRQPAALAQRGRRRGRAGPRRLGRRASGRWPRLYGLGFLPIAPEHYDFLLVESRRERPAVQAFLAALRDETRDRIRALGMRPRTRFALVAQIETSACPRLSVYA